LSLATIAALLCVIALGAAWAYERRGRARLRSALEIATGELERLQGAFSNFAPREVVDRIASGGKAADAGRKTVTILFADLVGSSALAERLDPTALVEIVNEYFARMSRVLAAHHGHVSKFIGDGMLALFGALEGNPWQANDAAEAALAMREELVRMNRDLEARGLPPLAVGIGIHHGAVIAGVIGNDQLREFTVIGSAVNLAARVEQLTRQHNVDILVTSAMRDILDSRFELREMPAAAVRGFREPVVTFALER
jgi:class 3 adenylate cyclase